MCVPEISMHYLLDPERATCRCLVASKYVCGGRRVDSCSVSTSVSLPLIHHLTLTKLLEAQ